MRTLVPDLNLNKQEILQKTLSFLVRQGKPSYSEVHLQCLYRVKTKNESVACAVGGWMEDTFIDPLKSILDIYTLILSDYPYSNWDNFTAFIKKNITLFEDLQDFHDIGAVWSSFEEFESSCKDYFAGDDYPEFTLNKEEWGIGNN